MFNMGLVESEQREIVQKNNPWTVRSIPLFKKEITINKTKYTFGAYELGRGGFGRVYPARRSPDGLFFLF